MTLERLTLEVEKSLSQIPIIDMHTHLIGGKLAARGLHDVLLYHMVVSDLYSAGCPSGARLTQYPGMADQDEGHSRIKEAIPYLKFVKNTHLNWGLRILLKDLYDWTKPLNETNWRKLDDLIRERADDREWQREIFKKVNIKTAGTELARRGDGSDDDFLQYALEWLFFTRCQWGEFDTAVYELERDWGKTPSSPMPIGGGKRPKPEREIKTLKDIHDAVEWCLKIIPYDQVLSTATHISTDLDLRVVSDAEMKKALANRKNAGEYERSVYASYINEAFLTGLEKQKKKIIFQFSYAAEPLPFETGSRVSEMSLRQVSEMVSRHPGIHFQCFIASRHGHQTICSFIRELPNLSTVGFWWHNFYPETMRQIFEDRLDMLPLNKQVAFFSDAYCAEWAYAKCILARKQMADVFARKIAQGQYDKKLAMEIAKEILFQSPQSILGMKVPKGR